ncbi:MAG: MarR family transcriptional regulator [Rhodospirillales bacterium CG15_BIG_FIL_POST_REV_8_21_14_020_66_15]|nr:MAG: MarR family transcriptional regulator [Rhodospirillales bacterium CG15_BIG_FIL_POST_REV_8_21_14_020_66_15]
MNKMDPMPLSEGRYLAFLIVEAARLQRTVFDRRVRNMGFTRTQWLVLRRVCDQPGISQRDLAETLEIERASAGRLIDKLEEFGWLERRPDDTDRRVKRIYLTELGRKIHREISPIAEAMVAEELSGLTGKERETLTNLLLTVKQRLQEMAGAAEPIDSKELTKKNA